MKIETLEAAYLEAKRNRGAPGTDGQTFEQMEWWPWSWPWRRFEMSARGWRAAVGFGSTLVFDERRLPTHTIVESPGREVALFGQPVNLVRARHVGGGVHRPDERLARACTATVRVDE